MSGTSWWEEPERQLDAVRLRRMERMPYAARIARYRDASRRGTAWLLARLAPDGALGDPAHGFETYRGPWTFMLAGEEEAARRVCDQLRRTLRGPAGRLDAPARGVETEWAYRDATLVVGAEMAGVHDLGRDLFPDLLRWEDPASGSFADDRLPDGSPSDHADVSYTAGVGFAALAAGRIDVARRIGGFLARLWAEQPEIDRATGLPLRLRIAWSRSLGRPMEPGDPGYEDWMLLDHRADRNQRWTAGGISAAFLCGLHAADPTGGWLALARRWQALPTAATPAMLRYPGACKTSWGAGALFAATGEEAYRAQAMRLGDWYAVHQGGDGSWRPWLERHDGDRVWITLEFVMHLENLLRALGERA